MKRSKMLLIALVCIALAAVFYINHKGFNRVFPSQNGSFTTGDAISGDGTYLAVQRAVKLDGYNVKMIRVDVYDAETGNLANSFVPARAMDFLGICWEEGTHNIWIDSGDIGIYCYAELDGKWLRDAYAVRPDSIVSKYDKYS